MSNKESCEGLCSIQVISPEMRTILHQEIKKTLHDVESELKDFTALIDEIQTSAPSEWEVLTVSPLTSSPVKGQSSRRQSSQLEAMDSNLRQAPLKDAFGIVRHLLAKLSVLVDRVSLNLKDDEDEYLSVNSPNFDLYYAQYVFQIALYVLRIVGRRLMQFCETLEECSKPSQTILEDGASILHSKTQGEVAAKDCPPSILRKQSSPPRSEQPSASAGVKFQKVSEEEVKVSPGNSDAELDVELDAAVERYVVETYQKVLQSLKQKSTLPTTDRSEMNQFQLSNFSGGRSRSLLFSSAPLGKMREEVLFCGPGCHQGELLHPLHDHLPQGTMEVREVKASGQLQIQLEPWVPVNTGVDEYQLISSLMHLEKTSQEGRKKVADTRLRHSIGSSQLDLVRLVEKGYEEGMLGPVHSEPKVVPVGFGAVEMPTVQTKGFKPLRKWHPVARKNRTIVDKLWKFYDELAKRKYCTGSPLILKLRRNSIVDGAFKALMAPSRIPLNYYQGIKVQFSQDEEQVEEEEGMDDVLSADEFFPLLGEALFSSHHLKLFDHPSEETNYLYPNPASSALPEWFQFCGVVLALAFLYQKPLQLNLPKCFFKCLFNRPMSLPDLEELDPLLLKRLTWVSDHDLSSHSHPLTFTVRDRMGSLSYCAELVAGGAEVAVTEENKQDYVEACVRWKLAERCLLQLQEIRKGFVSILDPKLLDRFTEEELQAMIEKSVDYSSSEDEEMHVHKNLTTSFSL